MSLGSHAKTVCSYLNDFKATHSDLEDDPAGDNQAGYSRKFFNYLISFCWGRLHRRLTSWAGLGFVDKLQSTWLALENEDAINEFSRWESFNMAHTGDKSLTNFLSKHKFILPLLDALLLRTGSFEAGSFVSLTEAVKENQSSLFTKDTAAEFHKLVCGGFIMLTALLEEFKAHYRTWRNMDDETRDTALRCFRRIGLYTRLLLNILASTSFRHYITFMAQRGVKSLVPLFENRSSYVSKWEFCNARLAGDSESPGVAPIEGEVMNAAGSSSESNKADPPEEEESEADLQVWKHHTP